MTRRDRLMATLQGQPVDRPAVSFYELNGLDERPEDSDPFNIYADPSWRPLIELTRERTDRIVMRSPDFRDGPRDPVVRLSETEVTMRGGSRYTVRRLRLSGGAGSQTRASKVLTCRTRRDPDVNTEWVEEPLLKGAADLEAFLRLPRPAPRRAVDPSAVLEAESALGDAGIVMIDTADPLCLAASLFDMAEYTVVALTERKLFRELLDWFAEALLAETEVISAALPGRLWRIYGPEYASPPYLPPALFPDYVCRYERPMVEAIQRHGGYARIHSHGNLKAILDDIASMGPDGLDPIEPPPQGDVELDYVRERYGESIVLFGNLEVSDIENLATGESVEKVRRALEQGTAGSGRGFVLMPTACPYGRKLSPLTLRNYEAMVEAAQSF